MAEGANCKHAKLLAQNLAVQNRDPSVVSQNIYFDSKNRNTDLELKPNLLRLKFTLKY